MNIWRSNYLPRIDNYTIINIFVMAIFHTVVTITTVFCSTVHCTPTFILGSRQAIFCSSGKAQWPMKREKGAVGSARPARRALSARAGGSERPVEPVNYGPRIYPAHTCGPSEGEAGRISYLSSTRFSLHVF